MTLLQLKTAATMSSLRHVLRHFEKVVSTCELFAFVPVNLLASTRALVWFVKFHFQMKSLQGTEFRKYLDSILSLIRFGADYRSLWFVLFVAKCY